MGLLWNPPVQEEAVPGLGAVWKQRQRWAEGGLQRFFDYWPTLTSAELSLRQRWNLACFFLLQYGLPVVSFADLGTSLIGTLPPTGRCRSWPSVFGIAYWRGCRGGNEGPIPRPGSGTWRSPIWVTGLW